MYRSSVSRDLPEGIRHGVRGEPTGRDLPTELELNEAGDRARREHDAHPQQHRRTWRKRFGDWWNRSNEPAKPPAASQRPDSSGTGFPPIE
jgi:hypothetical protein